MAEAPGKPNWAGANSAEAVGKLLGAKHRGLEVQGFDDRYKPDIRAVREFAEAIDYMLSKYPQVELTTVSITKPPPPAGAETAWAWATPSRTKGYLSAAIDLNADMARDWAACGRQMQDELDAGWAFGRPATPVYSAIVHEFGHAVDYATMKRPREKQTRHEKTGQVLLEAWERAAPGVGYGEWLREQLSEYSFIDGAKGNDVEPWEVLAEAFADAVLNGSNARDTSKALHKMMVDDLITARGK